ncbi:MAG: M56 family metallopeptidase [Parvularculaceae bacterium]
MTASSILGWLFETSLAVSILIILVLALRRPAARVFGPEAAYLMWLAPLGRLFMPELSILPAPAIDAASLEASPIGVAFAAPVAAEPAGFSLPDLAVPALIVWAAGAAAFLLWRLAAQKRFLHRARADSDPPSQALLAEAKVVAQKRGLKRAFDLRIMHDETGPLVAGFFRPAILLPRSFAHGFTPEERQMALAHEFAHIARGDLFVALVALVFRALQWPNPLAHTAYKPFRADQEAACDAAVLARCKSFPDAPHAYAAAIVKAARGRAAAPAGGLSIAHHVKERLMLMKANRVRPVAGRIAAATLIATGLAASASYGYAADKKKVKADDGVKVEKTVDVMRVVVDGDDERAIKMKRMFFVGDDIDVDADVVSDGEPHVWVFRTDKDADARVMTFSGGGVRSIPFAGDCSVTEGEPSVLKFSEEEGDEKHTTFGVVCVSGDEAADPAKTAEALRKAIDKMEADAAREAERRARTIAGLREQLKKLEEKAKAEKKEKKAK